MSEETPDRLKSFRAEYNGSAQSPNRWGVALLILTTIGFVIVIALLITGGNSAARSSNDNAAGMAPEELRRYANYLAERHLTAPAVQAYEDYLAAASIDNETRSNVCQRMAEIAVEGEDYETALAYLYQAEMLNPDSPKKAEIDKAVALCLDKLGRNVDLRRELRRRTAAHRDSDPDAGEIVLAEFPGDTITDRDLEMELEQLPPAAREEFATPDQQAELLRNLVAERLLVERARRLQLEDNPEIQERLEASRDALLVRELVRQEVESRIQITPQDVERFYRAEIEHFTEPATAVVRVATAETEEAAGAITEFPKATTRVVESRPIHGLKNGEDAAAKIFAAEPGSLAGPFEAEDGWRAYKVVAVTPAKTAPFEQVKAQAERMLRTRKQQEAMQQLLAETLDQQDVRIYPERIAEAREQ